MAAHLRRTSGKLGKDTVVATAGWVNRSLVRPVRSTFARRRRARGPASVRRRTPARPLFGGLCGGADPFGAGHDPALERQKGSIGTTGDGPEYAELHRKRRGELALTRIKRPVELALERDRVACCSRATSGDLRRRIGIVGHPCALERESRPRYWRPVRTPPNRRRLLPKHHRRPVLRAHPGRAR